MKKYMIIALCLMHSLNAMEQSHHKNYHCDAQVYEDGSQFQAEAFLYFLHQNNIDVTNKIILDVGCKTGKIAAQLAAKASSIHGFDAKKNMIYFAQNKYAHINNLTFQHISAENFTAEKKFNLAFASFSIPWIADKKQALCNIYNSLEINGELFGIFKTTDNPEPIHFALMNQMMPIIQQYVPADAQEMANPLGSSYLSQHEYTNILQEAGFEIIRNQEQSFDCIMNKDELTKFQWALFLRRPIIQQLEAQDQKIIFEQFMERYLEKLSKINDEQYLNKVIINVVHARKVKD